MLSDDGGKKLNEVGASSSCRNAITWAWMLCHWGHAKHWQRWRRTHAFTDRDMQTNRLLSSRKQRLSWSCTVLPRVTWRWGHVCKAPHTPTP